MSPSTLLSSTPDAIESELETLVPISTRACVCLAPLELPQFRAFAELLVGPIAATPVVLLGVLVLVERLKARLAPRTMGTRETAYRVFVASLIISAKSIYDVPPENSVWADILSPWFPPRELNQMERQLVQFLEYRITLRLVDMENVLWSHAILRGPSAASPIGICVSLETSPGGPRGAMPVPAAEERARSPEPLPFTHATMPYLTSYG